MRCSQIYIQIGQCSPMGNLYIIMFLKGGRIHNNDEGRWQHPELTGQRLRTKSVFKGNIWQLSDIQGAIMVFKVLGVASGTSYLLPLFLNYGRLYMIFGKRV
jgi:hypothetical protein